MGNPEPTNLPPGLYFVAALYGWAGSPADAVRVIETGAAARNPWIGLTAVFGEYDGLRENPLFAEILRARGLPNGNTAYRDRASAGNGPASGSARPVPQPMSGSGGPRVPAVFLASKRTPRYVAGTAADRVCTPPGVYNVRRGKAGPVRPPA